MEGGALMGALMRGWITCGPPAVRLKGRCGGWCHACSFVSKGMARPRLRWGRKAKAPTSPGRWSHMQIIISYRCCRTAKASTSPGRSWTVHSQEERLGGEEEVQNDEVKAEEGSCLS